jgi:hypothetical protein
MIPHEKEMVERLKDQPFALIGINSDGGRDAVQKNLKEEQIRWNVHGWPTIYILDAEGRIRHRDLRGEEMEHAVKQLLAESARATGN